MEPVRDTMDAPAEAARRAAVLRSQVRRRIFTLVGGNGDGHGRPLTASELAEILDLHVTTVRFHLDQLEAAGVLTCELRRGRVGRPHKLYWPSQPVDAPPDGAVFDEIAALLSRAPAAGVVTSVESAEEVGHRSALHRLGNHEALPPARTPGAWLCTVGRVLDQMLEWGYQAAVTSADAEGAQIEIVDCPFLAVDARPPDVECGVHRGLLRGALEALGAPSASVTLTHDHEPRTCTAMIARKDHP